MYLCNNVLCSIFALSVNLSVEMCFSLDIKVYSCFSSSHLSLKGSNFNFMFPLQDFEYIYLLKYILTNKYIFEYINIYPVSFF